jgi:hypothetical protein
MKKISVFLLSAILAACTFSPGIWARDNRSDETHKSKGSGKSVPSSDVTGQSESKADQNGRYKTEVRKGASVAQRAKQLRARNKGFAKAYADILKRGGTPLFEEAGVSVIVHDSKASLARDSKASPFKKVSTSVAQQLSDGDYEMSFFPFDTGDDAVWEGTIYVRGPQSEETWAVSFGTTHERAADLDIYYENFYAGDGGELDQAVTPGREGGSSAKAGYVAAGLKGAPNAAAYQRFRSWINCVNQACYGAMRACIWTGPFYFICFNTLCLNAMMGCIPPLNL